MRKFLIIVLVAFGMNVKAQFILAGTHGVQDYYYDIVPDTIIHSFDNGYVYYTNSPFLLDINNDGVNDFTLITGDCPDCFQPTSFRTVCSISPLNNNLIAIARFDSCFDNYCTPPQFKLRRAMADSFSLNDSINSGRIWINSIAYLAETSPILGSGCGPYTFVCGSSTFGANSKYIGVAVSDTSGISYGWIRVKSVSGPKMTIQEYSCNSTISTGVQTFTKSISLTISPNPARGTTRIDYTFPPGVNQGEIVFYDLQGKEIKRYKVDKTFDHLLISTADIQAGTYFYQLWVSTPSGQTSAAASAGNLPAGKAGKMVVIK